jgi:hypothetical protein
MEPLAGPLSDVACGDTAAAGRAAAPVTAVLVADGENEHSWLRAGRALQRMLLRAASHWVFASLQSQPLQSASVRAQIRSSLRPTGSPQMLLELGVARTSCPTDCLELS